MIEASFKFEALRVTRTRADCRQRAATVSWTGRRGRQLEPGGQPAGESAQRRSPSIRWPRTSPPCAARVNEARRVRAAGQRQGQNRIVVELPGIRDAAEVSVSWAGGQPGISPGRQHGRAAVRESSVSNTAVPIGPAPVNGWSAMSSSPVSAYPTQRPASTRTAMPNVQISLDSEGGSLMSRATRNNVKRRMGVLFIERKYRTRYETQPDGSEIAVKVPTTKLLTAPVIQSALGAQFRITGLDSQLGHPELALMLRAGAWQRPFRCRGRTVGPPGAENIRMGIKSVYYGLGMVVLFMILVYRLFGVTAVIALSVNIVLLVACISLIGATLTLPGIAGIVLTVGMAVDANVLIFGRIREVNQRHGAADGHPRGLRAGGGPPFGRQPHHPDYRASSCTRWAPAPSRASRSPCRRYRHLLCSPRSWVRAPSSI